MGMNNNQMGMNINQMGMNNNQMGMDMSMNMGNGINMMNQNIMNPMINPMLINNQPIWMMQYNNLNNNPILNNQNLILNDESQSTGKINIIFIYKEKKYNEICKFDEKIQIVVQRFCDKMGANFKNFTFISSAKKLNLKLTVAEAGMSDMSTILMIQHKEIQQNNFNLSKESDEKIEQDNEYEEERKINIIFRTTKGVWTNILANVNSSIENLIKNYFKIIDREDLIGNNQIAFLYNASKIYINDKKKVKDFFKDNSYPIITVNDIQDLIGA